jgi:hypothetical protein
LPPDCERNNVHSGKLRVLTTGTHLRTSRQNARLG